MIFARHASKLEATGRKQDRKAVTPTVHNAILEAAIEAVSNQLYNQSECADFGISLESFTAILLEVGRKYIEASATESDARGFFAGLRSDELVLARACAAGNERAWEVFLTRYREKLYSAALRIAREDAAARELADSLYADLYGTNLREGRRMSKLSSYTGRGSLEGWLRTVVAQEYVNRYRKTRRLVSLEQESDEGAQYAAPEPEPASAADPGLAMATDEALSALSNEDRTILASYFLDERTLAEIGRMLGVHESTISRRVERLTRSLRKQILANLGRHGRSRRQAEEALEADVRDLRLDIRRSLTQETATGTFSERKVRARAGDGTE